MFERCSAHWQGVALLDQHPSRNRSKCKRSINSMSNRPKCNQSNILPSLRKRFERCGFELLRNDNFKKSIAFNHQLSRRRINRSIKCDDASVCRDWIASVCTQKCIGCRIGDRGSTWIRVFDNGACELIRIEIRQVLDQFQSRACIEEIVVRKSFSVQEWRAHNGGLARTWRDIRRGALMWIFAITKLIRFHQVDRHHIWKIAIRFRVKPCADRTVIRSSA